MSSAGSTHRPDNVPHGARAAPERARVLLIPIPWGATVSAAAAPEAILAASASLEPHEIETGRLDRAGLATLPLPETVAGCCDAARSAAAQPKQQSAQQLDALGEQLASWLEQESRDQLAAGRLVGVVGGDRSAAHGLVRAAARSRAGIGVLHVGAQAALRAGSDGLRWSPASAMHNVLESIPEVAGIVQVGVRECSEEEARRVRDNPRRLRSYFDADLRSQLFDGEVWSRIAKRVVADLPREVYLSFDVGGLDPALFPSGANPIPGGLSFAEAVALLRILVESGRRVVAFDLCEVSVGADGGVSREARIAARLLYKLIGFALLSQLSPEPGPATDS